MLIPEIVLSRRVSDGALVIENDSKGENAMTAAVAGTELSFRRFRSPRFGAVGTR
jgi:hypothetical protein